MNAHDVLGVAKSSTASQIKKAWRKLSQQFHPDRNKTPGAEERFKLVQEAYVFLTSGKTHTDAFKTKPTPKPKPTPPPAPPQQWQNAEYFSVPKVTINLSFEQLFTNQVVMIPGYEFWVRPPQGVSDGYTDRQRGSHISNVNSSAAFDITYRIIDPTGFYQIRNMDGVQVLYCELRASITAILAENEVGIRNINPEMHDVTFKLDISGSKKIEHAGLPYARGPRGLLFVKILPVYNSLDKEQTGNLMKLRDKITEELASRKRNGRA